MELQKLELLLKRVNQAVKTIQKFKETELKYQQEIKKLTDENIKLQEENLNLKKEVNIAKQEIQNNNSLYKELEDKIVEILKYLPDDENAETNSSQSQQVDTNTTDQSEEEMLKTFVKEQKEDSKEPSIDFFSNDTQTNSINVEQKDNLNNQEKPQENNIEEKIPNEANESKFGELLFDNYEEKEINFDFEDDNSSNKNDTGDLPRGVL